MIVGQVAAPPHPQCVLIHGSTARMNLARPVLSLAPSPSESAKVDSYAAQKFREACEEKLVTFGGPTFLGELRETIQFLTRPFPAIIRASKRFYLKMLRIYRRIPARRRNRPGNKRKIAETLQDGWLSWKLAVSPLIGDIESAAEVIANYDKTVTLQVRAAQKGEFNPTQGADNPLGCTMLWDSHTEYRCSITGALKASIVPPAGTPARCMQMLQMDYRGLIENFIPTVYQLIPMSFLLDYVSNAGAVLQSMCVAQPQLAWSSTTRKTTQYRNMYYYPEQTVAPKMSWYKPPHVVRFHQVGEVHHEYVTISRTSAVPDIKFYFELPNVQQTMTITALLKLASRLLRA